VQVSERERQSLLDALFKDICTIVAEKCVNSETGRPFSVELIGRALKEMHFSLKAGQTAKQQVFHWHFVFARSYWHRPLMLLSFWRQHFRSNVHKCDSEFHYLAMMMYFGRNWAGLLRATSERILPMVIVVFA